MRVREFRAAAFAWVAAAYLAAGALAFEGVQLASGRPLWQVILVADLLGTVTVFAFSRVFDNSSFYDPYWSVAPMVIALAIAAGPTPAGVPPARQVVVTTLVLVWGARLTYNWARGWRGLDHEDWRYVELRERAGRAYWWVSLVGIHLLPTVWVYLGCLSLVPTLARGSRPLGVLDAVACAVTLGAILLEAGADEQLRAFRRDLDAPGPILASGLWRYCRHPNYLGEILFWWGLFFFALAADGSSWPCIAGPLSISFLFKFISIPMIDRRSLARRPGYGEHMARVPALLPRPWRRPPEGGTP